MDTKLGVAFVQSHHLNFGSGNETMLQHAFRLEIPDGAPLSLSSFFAQQISDTSFEIQFALAQIPAAQNPPGSATVLELTSVALAGPKDLSTAAPSGLIAPGLSLRAWPNVTDGMTRLNLSQPRGRLSLVDIHDLRGRLVRRLQIPPLGTQVEWDGRNDAGHRVGSGMYLARLVGERGWGEKIVVVK